MSAGDSPCDLIASSISIIRDIFSLPSGVSRTCIGVASNMDNLNCTRSNSPSGVPSGDLKELVLASGVEPSSLAKVLVTTFLAIFPATNPVPPPTAPNNSAKDSCAISGISAATISPV